MAISVNIGGNPVSILNETLKIDKRIEERSIASFIVRDLTGTEVYVRGMPVSIYDSVPSLIFSGFIDTPGRARVSPDGTLFHDITCVDNHYLADKRLVVNSYQDKTTGYIVEDIFDKYLFPEGITIGEIQAGPTVTEAIFNYVKVSEAYDASKELSGTFIWFISDDKKLYFIDRVTNTTPWDLDGIIHKALEGSIHLSEGNPLYRNFQYSWGGLDTSTLQTLNFTGDGETKTFTLGYPLAKVPVVKENTVAKTIGIKGIDTDKDYYWSKGDSTIYAEIAPAIGVNIEVQYYGQYPLISVAVDGDAIATRRAIEGGTGIVEDIVREAWHESKQSSRQSAKAKLTQYCQEAEKFTYQTYESGLLPGQLQAITYAPFGFTSHNMLIESISITTKGDLIFYDVSCITGPSMGSWSRLFQRLLTRQDQSIRIGGDLLLKYLLYEETLGLSEVANLHSDDFSDGIVNRWIALPPAQSKGYNIEHEALALVETPSRWEQAKGQYCWAPKSNGAGLRELKWDFGTWG